MPVRDYIRIMRRVKVKGNNFRLENMSKNFKNIREKVPLRKIFLNKRHKNVT